MKIIYTKHLKLRLHLRKIPENYPKSIYKYAEKTYFDSLENKFIAIKKLTYNGKSRSMMIAYEKEKI